MGSNPAKRATLFSVLWPIGQTLLLDSEIYPGFCGMDLHFIARSAPPSHPALGRLNAWFGF